MEKVELKIRLNLLDTLIERYKRIKSEEYSIFIEAMKIRKANLTNDFGVIEKDGDTRIMAHIPQWIYNQINYILTHQEEFLDDKAREHMSPCLFLVDKDERKLVMKHLKKNHPEFFLPNKL